MKETRKEYKARWYREHSEAVKARAVKWAKDNPEKERARKAQWQRDNSIKVNARNAKWKQENPEAVRINLAKRRAIRLKCEEPHYTVADVEVLLAQQQSRCLYCYSRLDAYHIDHVVPLSRGGGNGPDNICVACPSCNLSKGNKLLGSEWIPPYRADANFLLAFSG